MMKNQILSTGRLAALPLLLSFSMAATAGPYGFDLHNVLSPKAAGLAGTNLAGDSMGPVEAVYGNPANLVDFKAGPGNENGTNFTFGATMYYPYVEVDHRSPGLPNTVPDLLANGVNHVNSSYRTESQAEYYAVPQIALTQDLSGVGVPVVLGLGLSAVSGIGVDYRDDDQTNGLGAEFIVLGINAGAGYEVMPGLDVGAAVTLSYGMIEAGFAGTNSQGHDYGLRYTLGADYELTDQTNVALQFQSELRHKWDDGILLSNSTNEILGALDDRLYFEICNADPTIAYCNGPNARGGSDGNWNDVEARYHTLSIEQPRNIALGVSHEFSDSFRVMSDVIFKEWSEADFWQRFYHDQTAFSIGAEMDRGPITWRLGYGYANDPNRDGGPEARALEGNDWACTGSPGHVGGCFPLADFGLGLGAQTWRYLQATETPVIYKHRVTAGMTWDGFLAPFLSLDAHVAWQLEEDEEYDYQGAFDLAQLDGTNGVVNVQDINADNNTVTDVEVSSIHAGFALNWKF